MTKRKLISFLKGSWAWWAHVHWVVTGMVLIPMCRTFLFRIENLLSPVGWTSLSKAAYTEHIWGKSMYLVWHLVSSCPLYLFCYFRVIRGLCFPALTKKVICYWFPSWLCSVKYSVSFFLLIQNCIFSEQSVLFIENSYFVPSYSTTTSSGPEEPLHDPGACCRDQDVDCALVSQQETCHSNLLSISME